jgi:hypothetical protein
VAYNAVTTLYIAHLASPVEPEIDDACRDLAAMLFAVLAPLPLNRPLRGATGAALATPPQLPWLFVLPGAQPGQEEKLDQLHVGDWHSLDLLFLFTGALDAIDAQVLANLDYLYATKLAISENRNLDTGVSRIGVTGWEWARTEFAAKLWGGLLVHTRLMIRYGMRAAW